MDNLLSRHRNVSILVAVLFAQVLGLAVQVKRSANAEESRLIRVWAVSAVTPFEKALVWTQNTTSGWWHNYLFLRGVRAENRDLKQQIERMRLEQVRLSEDAEQARRLQLLLAFKEKFISQTLAAQVIGSSGSEKSRSIYIDKGSHDGVKPDQAVITGQGIVGKVLSVYGSTSLVLLINDQSSGVGVILEKSRLQGVLRGSATGQVMVEKILNDETVQPGERVLTSGGDQIFPKGLDVGTVSKVDQGKKESFLEIQLQPAAHLSKLEEVLVVTKVEDRAPTPSEVAGQVRAVDILTRRLPSVPDKPAETGLQGAAGQTAGSAPQKPTLSTGAPKTGIAEQKLGAPSAVKASAANATTGQASGAQSAPKTGVTANSGTSAKTASPASAVSGQSNLTQSKPSTAGASTGTAKPGASSQTPTSPAQVKKVPSPNPNNIGTSESVPNAKVTAKPAIKPTSSSADTLSNDVKPAVVQKPVNPAGSTLDQSANPAKKQPAKAGPEANPQ
jgi:rod shape-determining protein MreC